MTTKKVKHKIIIYTLWSLAIISFLVFLTFIQFKANGWKINWQTHQIIKTGMVTLGGLPSNSEVALNNRIIDSKLPTKISDLSPGFYDISVKSSGYTPWQQTIRVYSQKATIFDFIVLFFEKPEVIDIPMNITIDSVQNEFNKNNDNLKIINTELYWQDTLITRFSQSILMATMYPDQKHIVFQLGNEIRIIDINGTNNILLATLQKPDPTSLIFRQNGKVIYYIDNDKVNGLIIR